MVQVLTEARPAVTDEISALNQRIADSLTLGNKESFKEDPKQILKDLEMALDNLQL
jgi:hypothetical protein